MSANCKCGNLVSGCIPLEIDRNYALALSAGTRAWYGIRVYNSPGIVGPVGSMYP